MVKFKLRNFLNAFLRPRGKIAFLKQLPPNAKVLDVGCGNNSPYITKLILPDCYYVGLDIGAYNQVTPNVADEYLLASPVEFSASIAQHEARFDAVVSAHNIEHCNDRNATFSAMLRSLVKGGQLFMAFPCEESINFPRRWGTLNYYDDKSHVSAPPDYRLFIRDLINSGFDVRFTRKRYRPFLLAMIGLLLEPISSLRKRPLPGTWALYGFESIIWATKK